MSDFGAASASAYAVEELSIELGKGALEGKLVPEAEVRLPLRTTSRHGLIAGATGTGKTRTLQVLAKQLSAQMPGQGATLQREGVRGVLSLLKKRF